MLGSPVFALKFKVRSEPGGDQKVTVSGAAVKEQKVAVAFLK